MASTGYKVYAGSPVVCTKSSECGSALSNRCGLPGITKAQLNSVLGPGETVHLTCCPPGTGRSATGLCLKLPKGSYCLDGNHCADDRCGFPGDISKVKVCCHSGETHNHFGHEMCTDEPIGSLCLDNEGCINRHCGHKGSMTNPKICCKGFTYSSGEKDYCADGAIGDLCEANRGCASGVCYKDQCVAHQPVGPVLTEIVVVIIIIIVLIIVGYVVLKVL